MALNKFFAGGYKYYSPCFRHLQAIFVLVIDFPVQVSHKPKGIAVGAAKECVHTLSRVFLRSENLSRAKNDDAGTVGADTDFKRERGRG